MIKTVLKMIVITTMHTFSNYNMKLKNIPNYPEIKTCIKYF